MESNILWEGQVAVKNGWIAKTCYALIFKDKIIIRKSINPVSEILNTIEVSHIKSITAGKGDMNELMFKGYQGYLISYQKSPAEAESTMRLWPNSFGAYPNTTQVAPFAKVLSEVFPTFDGISIAKSQTNAANYMIMIFIFLIPSILLCGPLPGGMIAISGVFAAMLWNYEKMDVTLRKVLAVLLFLFFVFLALVINVLAGISIFNNEN
jgi:hypothetical protein